MQPVRLCAISVLVGDMPIENRTALILRWLLCIKLADQGTQLTRVRLSQYRIDQQGRTLCHPPRTATGAETAPLTTESDQALSMAGVATQPQIAMFESAALEKFCKFPLPITR